MNNLGLSNPKMMDVAVPANMRQGLAQDAVAAKGWALSAAEAIRLGRGIALVDLRERSERERHGVIPGALHAPYPALRENLAPGGLLCELAAASERPLVFFCAFGERSAMAVQAAQAAGITKVRHVQGGMAAWREAAGPIGVG
jgi:rhodanese-related sulfurtransferase